MTKVFGIIAQETISRFFASVKQLFSTVAESRYREGGALKVDNGHARIGPTDLKPLYHIEPA